MTLLWALAVAFAWRYPSHNPWIGRWSLAYLAGGLLPMLLLGLPLIGSPPIPPRRWHTVALTVIVVLLTLLWSSFLPDSRCAVAALFLVPSLWVLIVTRHRPASGPLLLAIVCSLLGGILLLPEVPDLLRPAKVRWGSASTFEYLFPETPPFLGPGGRLRPNLRARMEVPQHTRGVDIVTDSHGFRSAGEIAPSRSPDVFRVLNLGDSFSIGYGHDQLDFFGERLAQHLRARARGTTIEVLSAEVSDPAYGLYYLQRWGQGFGPDVVIYGLSGNDLFQAGRFAGPHGRFSLDEDGELRANPTFDPDRERDALREHPDLIYPRASQRTRSIWSRVAGGGPGPLRHLIRMRLIHALYEPIWRERSVPMVSLLASLEANDGRKRLVDGTSNLALFYPAAGPVLEPYWGTLFELLKAFQQTAQEHGCGFVLVIFPQRYQIHPEDWQIMKQRWSLREEDFDLHLANSRLESLCQAVEMTCADLLAPLRRESSGGSLYLPFGDMHLNERGTDIAAQAVSYALLGDLPVPTSAMATP